MDKFDSGLFATAIRGFLEDVQRFFVPLARREAQNAVKRHHVAGTRATYGYDLWQLIWDAVRREAAASAGFPFQIAGAGRVSHPNTGLSLFFYRCGSSLYDSIEVCFPRVGKAAVADAEAKLYGTPMFPADIQEPKNATFVVVMMANSEDGLFAAHLASVGRINRRRVVRWQFTQLLWRLGEEGKDGASAGKSPDVPPVEVAPKHTLKRLPRRREGESV